MLRQRLDVEELYRRYGHVVFRRCRALLGVEEDAMDAMQEVFVRTLKYGRGFRRSEKPLPWLFQIANRVCFDRLRRRGRDVTLEPEMDTRPAPGGSTPDAERRAIALDLLERFDPLTQELAIGYHVDGLSMAELAVHVGRSRKTVGKRLAKFRAQAGALVAEEEGA